MEPEQENFEDIEAPEQKGVLKEFSLFLMQNKKYWMLPIIILLLAFGALIIAGGSSAAPFIYTLF